jgi:hypothetical protein
MYRWSPLKLGISYRSDLIGAILFELQWRAIGMRSLTGTEYRTLTELQTMVYTQSRGGGTRGGFPCQINENERKGD